MKKRYGSYTVDGRIIYLLWFLEIVFRVVFSFFRLFSSSRRDPFVSENGTILVIEIVGMGDAVLATSIVRPLKKRFPDSKIVFLGNPAFIPVVEKSFDECIPLSAPWVRRTSKWAWMNGEWLRFFKETSRLRKHNFNISIDVRCDFRTAFLSFLIGAKHRTGFDFGLGKYFYTAPVPYGEMVHRSGEYAKILDYFNFSSEECSPFLVPDKQKVEDILHKLNLRAGSYYLIHPGAARKYKIWPLDNIVKVVKALKSTHSELTPVAIGGNGDRDALNYLKNHADNSMIVLTAGIDELNSLVSSCKFVLCNNTGVMHVAVALGRKVVTFIGPTDENIWSPLGSGNIVFQKSADLECYPCGEEVCVRPESPCIEMIHPEEVITAIDGALNSDSDFQ